MKQQAKKHLGYIGTRPENFALVKGIFLEELSRIRREKPSREEVEDAKQYLLGSLAFQFTTNDRVVVFFAGAEAIHYGGASSSAAPIHFYLEQCRANWQYWRKHHGWVARAAVLGAFAIHHSIRNALRE